VFPFLELGKLLRKIRRMMAHGMVIKQIISSFLETITSVEKEKVAARWIIHSGSQILMVLHIVSGRLCTIHRFYLALVMDIESSVNFRSVFLGWFPSGVGLPVPFWEYEGHHLKK